MCFSALILAHLDLHICSGRHRQLCPSVRLRMKKSGYNFECSHHRPEGDHLPDLASVLVSITASKCVLIPSKGSTDFFSPVILCYSTSVVLFCFSCPDVPVLRLSHL